MGLGDSLNDLVEAQGVLESTGMYMVEIKDQIAGSAAMAVAQINDLALHAKSENTQLKAAIYLVDTALAQNLVPQNSPVDEMLQKIFE